MLAGTGLDLDHELQVVTNELVSELSGRVPGPEVERAVRQAFEAFGEPPITQFLPILVRRRVQAQLTG